MTKVVLEFTGEVAEAAELERVGEFDLVGQDTGTIETAADVADAGAGAVEVSGDGAGALEIDARLGGVHARLPAGRGRRPRAVTEVVAWARAIRARSAPSSVSL